LSAKAQRAQVGCPRPVLSVEEVVGVVVAAVLLEQAGV
jgi:hypothetical protein